MAAPTPAQAGPVAWGRVCMFNAPTVVPKAGHVAWAFKVRGEKDHWIWGSFNWNEAWIHGGAWKDVRASFSPSVGYTRYRCTYTRDGNARDAQAAYKAIRSKGYNIVTNNCLHMSMAVFKGYSNILRRDPRLPSATAGAGTTGRPNDYFSNTLSNAHWERIHYLP
ncbi:hypothetical protein PUR34_11570 [Streptomyces sp. JV185]|uniref:hypothetical protein n=1 Tax=Streptomyces sp. JV185 TaxID=858638 RepID=UPI002E761EEE|nr:hypothetical protein [Streptomyces sp. JV185]MEE1768782.1 hypothetical protein [Streptomyces sp. JV185]